MAWRFVSDTEDAELRESASECSPPPDPLVEAGIYEVAGGTVRSCAYGDVVDAPLGWFVKVLDTELPDHTYRASDLEVLLYGKRVRLQSSTLVALFPREHLESARAAAQADPE